MKTEAIDACIQSIGGTPYAVAARLELAQLKAEVAKLAKVREMVDYMAQSIEAGVKARGPQTGMHVPYHGPFSCAQPSVVVDLRRFVRDFRAILDPEPKP